MWVHTGSGGSFSKVVAMVESGLSLYVCWQDVKIRLFLSEKGHFPCFTQTHEMKVPFEPLHQVWSKDRHLRSEPSQLAL